MSKLKTSTTSDRKLSQDELAKIYAGMTDEQHDDHRGMGTRSTVRFVGFPLAIAMAVRDGKDVVFPQGGVAPETESAKPELPEAFSFDATLATAGGNTAVLRYFVSDEEVGFVICWDNQSWFFPRGFGRNKNIDPVVVRIRFEDARLMLMEWPQWRAGVGRPSSSVLGYSGDAMGAVSLVRPVGLSESRLKDGSIQATYKSEVVTNKFDKAAKRLRAFVAGYYRGVDVTQDGETETFATRVNPYVLDVQFQKGTDRFAAVDLPASMTWARLRFD